MSYLVAVSLLWAFSFGLIKDRLAGLDATAVAALRLLFALLVFLPVFRPHRIRPRTAVTFAAIGAVQFGLMYVLYLAAFRYLQSFEIAMFTIFTPIYVILLDGAIARRLPVNAILAVLLAVVGAAVLQWRSGVSPSGQIGFLLMQASNLCFAAGQVAYQRLRPTVTQTTDAGLFGWLYLGGLLATLLASLATTEWADFRPDSSQWLTLLYLGIFASGLGFFGWNLGATKVSAGTLAVFNNLKIPLAVTVSLLVFGESTDPVRLILSSACLLAALFLAQRSSPEGS